MNTNFTKNDIKLDLPYDDAHLPNTYEASMSIMKNYLRRLKRAATKLGVTKFMFMCVTEYGEVGSRIHHHLVVTFPDRDLAEKLWHGGDRPRSRRIQPDDFGLEGLARYLTKQHTKKHKRYTTSRNLSEPKVSENNSGKVSRRQVAAIAMNENLAKEVFEQDHKGWVFNDMKTHFSDIVSGAYLYVRMRKRC